MQGTIHVYAATAHKTLPGLGISVVPGQEVNCVPGSPRDLALRGMVNRGFSGPMVRALSPEAESEIATVQQREMARVRADYDAALEKEIASAVASLRADLDGLRTENIRLREENEQLRGEIIQARSDLESFLVAEDDDEDDVPGDLDAASGSPDAVSDPAAPTRGKKRGKNRPA